jgi:hypothetical protein
MPIFISSIENLLIKFSNIKKNIVFKYNLLQENVNVKLKYDF